MRLAFFGSYGDFDYPNIGGTNSFIRRLSSYLSGNNHWQIDYIIYNYKDIELSHTGNIRSRYFGDIRNALDALDDYDHVVIINYRWNDAGLVRNRCKQQKPGQKIHMMYWEWAESGIIRTMRFYQKKIVPYNGVSFAISPRLQTYLSARYKQTVLLLPPVPENYFLRSSDKSDSGPVQITFIGRIDSGKGILETLELFDQISGSPDTVLNLYGTYWKNDKTAVKIHKELLSQEKINYFPVEFRGYNDTVENLIQSALKKTDVFVQPYRYLSSTIDTPLLILEAMASLDAVITPPLGNIPDFYPASPCLIPTPQMTKRAENLILSARSWLPQERRNIDSQNKKLKFDLPSVASVFCDAISESDCRDST